MRKHAKKWIAAATVAGVMIATGCGTTFSAIVNDLDKGLAAANNLLPLIEAIGVIPGPTEAALNLAIPGLLSVLSVASAEAARGASTPAEAAAVVAQLNQVLQSLPPTDGLDPVTAAKVNAATIAIEALLADFTPATKASPITAHAVRTVRSTMTSGDVKELKKIQGKANKLLAAHAAK